MKKIFLVVATGLLLSMAVCAQDELSAKAEKQLKRVLGPSALVSEVIPLASGQILEVVMDDGAILHMTPDLGFLLHQNALYQIKEEGLVNLSDTRMNARRAKSMASIKDEDAVIFKAKGEEKARITVFTDIDCGYCQKLHREIPEINTLGITVRYLAFPRSGILDPETNQPTDSFRKINYVWCQDDRSAAMTAMKTRQGEMSQVYSRVRSATSDAVRAAAMKDFDAVQKDMGKMMASAQCASPVAEQYRLGQSIGVNGTPAMVTDDGALIPGYMAAKDLAKRLGVL